MPDQQCNPSTPAGSPGVVLAADLGGTHFRVGLIDASGRLLDRHQIDTRAWEGPEAVLGRMADACRVVLDRVPASVVILGVGIAAPSPIDPKQGLIYHAPNLPGWLNVPLRDELQRRLGLPTLVGNDANLAALGEWRFGAAIGFDDLIFLTFSTGVGSGFVAGGRLVVGHLGLAGEAGHMSLDPRGPRCACGRLGCLEALASGTAIVAAARVRLATHPDSALHAYPDLTAEQVDLAAEQGDELAVDLVRQAAHWAGVGIANLVMVFDPGVVVLGGGVSRSGDIWWSTVRSSAEENLLRTYRATLRVVPAALGDDVGLFGAAAAVLHPELAGA